MGISFDTHELHALVKDFENASGGPAMKEVEKVVFVGALHIKRDAARRISGHRYLRGVAGAIDFDMYTSLRGPAAEIGPTVGKRQGSLGFVAEMGTINNPPFPFMAPAGEAEEPKFAKALEDLAVKAIEE